MAKTRRLVYIIYAWTIIITGYSILLFLYHPAMIDHWREYLIFVVLAVFAEWLIIPLPQGNLSVGFSVVLAAFLLFDISATAWICGAAILISNVLINKEKGSFRLTLFNGSQYIISTVLAGDLYKYLGGTAQNKMSIDNGLPILAFIAAYFIINHILVNLYILPLMRKYTMNMWKNALKLDFYTYIVSTPIGLLMSLIFKEVGIIGAVLIFSTVLVLSFILRFLMRLQIRNKELDVLYQVAKSLGESLDLKKTLYLILKETKRAINYHTGIIYLWHEKEGILAPAAVLSPYEKQLRDVGYKLGEGLIGSVAECMAAAFIPDTRKEDSLRSIPGVSQFLRSVMAIPLIFENKNIGVMIIGKKEAGEFNEKHLQLLTILGGQAAVAMTNAMLYKQIKEQAVSDYLTQLYNHRYFYRKLSEEFQRAERYSSVFSLIMMDIDNFKSFNDTYGHQVGDKVLKMVAKVIKDKTRTVDVVARYGGEEFAVLLPETQNKQAVLVAERIREAIDKTILEHNHQYLKVTLSIGVSTYPRDSEDLTEMVSKADQALYFSKESGKNRVSNWIDIPKN